MRPAVGSRGIVVGLALGVVLAFTASGTASAAPKPHAGTTGAPVTTIPFSGSGSVDGSGTGTPGDPARNAAVAVACNGGEEIGAPQWYRLPALGQKVLASVEAPFADTGRGWNENPSGLAYVDSATGKVLSCGDGPFALKRDRAVSLVAFYRFAITDCDWSVEDCYWLDGDLRLLVSPTSGVAPANDLQGNATPITALPYSGTADTSMADGDGDPYGFIDFEHCLLSAIDPSFGSTVWWSWTAPSTGPVPALSVDLGTPWPSTARAPQVVIGHVTAGGVVPVPREDPDPWNCDSPQVVEAGQTYLIGVAVYHDSYYETSQHNGAPVTLRVGPVAAPGAPDGVTLSPSSRGRASVSWQAPTNLGTAAVTGYKVILQKRVTGGWADLTSTRVPATTTSFTLKGLNPKEVYRVKVRALSSAGAGTPVKVVLATG